MTFEEEFFQEHWNADIILSNKVLHRQAIEDLENMFDVLDKSTTPP